MSQTKYPHKVSLLFTTSNGTVKTGILSVPAIEPKVVSIETKTLVKKKKPGLIKVLVKVLGKFFSWLLSFVVPPHAKSAVSSQRRDGVSWEPIPAIQISTSIVFGTREKGVVPRWQSFVSLTTSGAKSLGAIIECTSGELILRSRASGQEIKLVRGQFAIALIDIGCERNDLILTEDPKDQRGFVIAASDKEKGEFRTIEIVELPQGCEKVLN